MALVLSAILVLGGDVSVYASQEEIRDNLEAVKKLSDLDLEENKKTIEVLLEQCIELLSDDDPMKKTLESVQALVKNGDENSAAVEILLDSLINKGTDDEFGADYGGAVFSAEDVDIFKSAFSEKNLDLPGAELPDFVQTHIPVSILLDVPSDWGNNAAGERSLVSYSPVNNSGAISPKAGTLTISHFGAESDDSESVFSDYEKSISDMSVVSDMQSESISAASLPAKKLDFEMNVGANQFACETICFIYKGTVYAIELMQGQLSEYDYSPVFSHVVQSTEIIEESASTEEPEIMEEPEITEVPEATEEPEITEVPEVTEEPEITEVPEVTEEPEITEVPEVTEEPQITETPNDISSFLYELNGHTYQFPTAVSEIDPLDIYIDRQLELPYDISSDDDMEFGNWTEIINTEYFYYENSFYKEMVGITNMTGYDTVLSEGILTALIDTNGTYLDVNLPGGIHVGGMEEDILKGFSVFKDQTMDGTASYIRNDFLYACNVRDDGCNGYVLIKNDDPFYSAVSIICENSVIKEISFECLGSERAKGIFEN